MEQHNPSPPDPSAVTAQQVAAASSHVTKEPNDDPRWQTPHPPGSSDGSSALPILVTTSICVMGICGLGAMLGSWVLVMIGGVVLLLLFHYFTWGWFMSRMMAAQQREELLKLAERDTKYLPDPQRSRLS
jgi:hypothetical protein